MRSGLMLTVALAAFPAAAQPIFEVMDSPVPLDFPWRLEVRGMNHDATVMAVAETWRHAEPRAVIWTRESGYTRIDPPQPGTFVDVRAVSLDGTVFGGRHITAFPVSAAFLLDAQGFHTLPAVASAASDQAAVNALNADGSVAVGVCVVNGFFHAARWTDTLPEDLGRSLGASDITPDGSVIVGTAYLPDLGIESGWRRTAQGVEFVTDATGLPEGTATTVTGVSPDGSVAFGEAGFHGPFVWRGDADELLPLPDGPWMFAQPQSASDRGRVLAGWVESPAEFPPETAAVWSESTGPAILSDIFTQRFGFDLGDFGMFLVHEVSADGRTLAGTISPNFDGMQSLVWRAHLPVRWFAACPADLTENGTTDFFDLAAFLAHYESGSLEADFAFDNRLDFFDVAEFLSLYAGSCPLDH